MTQEQFNYLSELVAWEYWANKKVLARAPRSSSKTPLRCDQALRHECELCEQIADEMGFKLDYHAEGEE